MRKLLLLVSLAALAPSFAAAQLVGGNANVISDADSIAVGVSAQYAPGGWTVTGNYAAGPGTSGTQASRIINASGYNSFSMFGYYSQTPSSTYTFSVYVRETTSGSCAAGANLLYNNGGWVAYPALSTSWVRLSFQTTSNASGDLAVGQIAFPNGGQACDLLMWGAKLELGSSATGTYPTGSPAAATPTASPAAGSYGSTQTVSLSTTSGGAIICYTTNGTAPITNGTTGCTTGTKYTAAISVSTSQTIKAVAGGTGFTDSSALSATYTISAPAAVQPTASPVAGSYSSTQTVSLSTTTSGATICYTVNGATPADNGTSCTVGSTYTAPFSVSFNSTIKAIAFKPAAYSDSTVLTATYTITQPVTASPGSGSYTFAQNVALNSNAPVICYSTSGATPATNGASGCASGSLYTGLIPVTTSTTILAVSGGTGYADSSITSFQYVLQAAALYAGGRIGFLVGANVVAAPSMSPASGSYQTTLLAITASDATPGASIYLDTNNPPTTLYNGTYSITQSSTLYAQAKKTGFRDSAIASASYTLINQPSTVAAPLFSPGSGSYPSAFTVTSSTTTPGATMYIGQTSPPATQATSFTVAASGTWYAQAKKSGLADSPISSATYTINSGAGTGSWVTAAGAACVNGSALVPDANACEWKPCKDDPLPSVVYYVCDTGGNDSYTTAQAQNPATPWLTSSHAVSAIFSSLQAGQAIAFCRGGTFTTPSAQFNNTNGTQANPVVIRDYTRPGRAGLGDPRPLFNGEQFSAGIYPGRVKFENLAMHASVGNNAMIFDFGDTRGTTTDVTACNLEVSGAGIAFQFQFSGTTNTNFFYRHNIIGSRVLNSSSQGYLGHSIDGQIVDNWWWNNPTTTDPSNHTIYYDGHSWGNDANQTTGEIFSRNEIHAVSGNDGVVAGWEGIHRYLTIENNKILCDIGAMAQPAGWGMQVGGSGYGSELMYVEHAVVRGNIIYNCGNQMLGVASCKSDCLVENNLIVNTQQWTRGISAPSEINNGVQVSSGIVVRNNTVYTTYASSQGIVGGGEGSGHIFENNAVQAPYCYVWNSGGTAPSRDYNACQGTDTPVGLHSLTSSDLKWIAPTGVYATMNYKPNTGSPLIGVGDPAQKPTLDITGAARPTTPDIGAYQH